MVVATTGSMFHSSVSAFASADDRQVVASKPPAVAVKVSAKRRRVILIEIPFMM
jgi:hypothetical protein